MNKHLQAFKELLLCHGWILNSVFSLTKTKVFLALSSISLIVSWEPMTGEESSKVKPQFRVLHRLRGSGCPHRAGGKESLCCPPPRSFSCQLSSSMGGGSISWKDECRSPPLSRAAGPQLGMQTALSQLRSVLEHEADFATAKNLCFWNKNHLFSVDSLILMNCRLFFLLADVPWKGTHAIRCQRRAAWSNFRGTHHCVFSANTENEYHYVSPCSDSQTFPRWKLCFNKGLLFAF